MSNVEQRLIVTKPQSGVYPDYEELVERVKAVEAWQEDHSPVSPFTDDKNPAPQKREWISGIHSLVWRARWHPELNKWSIEQVSLFWVEQFDLWMPVLDPNEPAPEAPREKRE